MLWHTSGFVVWLTGLPASGKTTLANSLQKEFIKKGVKSEILDGDEIRKNISPEVGFSRQERELHAKRIAYIGKLLSRNGIATIVSLISPFRSSRDYARSVIPTFVEVWVNCPLEICKKRDPKGLYYRALKGEVLNFTGIQDPYESPTNPEIILDTNNELADKNISTIKNRNTIIEYLLKKSYVWEETAEG